MSEPVWTSEFQGAFAHCRYLLGDELLAFLVGVPEVRADDRRTVRTVRKLAATLDLLEREDPRLPVALVRKRQPDGLPLAWGMRKANGGDVPEPLGSDELEQVLTQVARDVYPVLLGPSDAMIVTGPGLTLPAADATIAIDQVVESHPEHQRAAALLDATGLPHSDLLVASAFGVERMSDIATLSALIAAAVRRLRSVERPDAARLMSLVIELLGEVRVLADTRRARVPACIGLTALPMAPDCHVPLPQGTLRAPSKSERRFVPFTLQAEAVLSTTVACQAFEPGQDTSAPQADGQMMLHRLAREVTLAVALSSDVSVPRSCPSVAWIVSHDLGHGSGSSRPLHPERLPGAPSP